MCSSTTATGKSAAIQPGAPGFTAGFASLDAEIDTAALPVTGTIPDWLRGALLRNGPALFDTSQRSFRHWFDGQAMLHRFAIADGTVSYRNRVLEHDRRRRTSRRGRRRDQLVYGLAIPVLPRGYRGGVRLPSWSGSIASSMF